MNSSAKWMMMTSRRESRIVGRAGRSSDLKKLLWTSCHVTKRRRLSPLLPQQELPHLLLRHCTLALLVLLVLVPASVAQNCSTKCGSMDVGYPFGLEPGCGSFEFRDLLNCTLSDHDHVPRLFIKLNLSASSATNSAVVVGLVYDGPSSLIRVRGRSLNDDCSELPRGDGQELEWVPSGPEWAGQACESSFSSMSQTCFDLHCPTQNVCGYDTSSTGEHRELCVASCPDDCSGLGDQPAASPADSQSSPQPLSPQPLSVEGKASPPQASPRPAQPSAPLAQPSAPLAQPSPPAAHGSVRKALSAAVGAGGALLLVAICFLCVRWVKSWNKGRVKGQQMRDIANILNAGSSPSNMNGVTMFSYKELAAATKNFAHNQQLGGGGFNTVYKGKLRDGRLVAVKKLNQANRQGIDQFRTEVTVLIKVDLLSVGDRLDTIFASVSLSLALSVNSPLASREENREENQHQLACLQTGAAPPPGATLRLLPREPRPAARLRVRQQQHSGVPPPQLWSASPATAAQQLPRQPARHHRHAATGLRHPRYHRGAGGGRAGLPARAGPAHLPPRRQVHQHSAGHLVQRQGGRLRAEPAVGAAAHARVDGAAGHPGLPRPRVPRDVPAVGQERRLQPGRGAHGAGDGAAGGGHGAGARGDQPGHAGRGAGAERAAGGAAGPRPRPAARQRQGGGHGARGAGLRVLGGMQGRPAQHERGGDAVARHPVPGARHPAPRRRCWPWRRRRRQRLRRCCCCRCRGHGGRRGVAGARGGGDQRAHEGVAGRRRRRRADGVVVVGGGGGGGLDRLLHRQR